MPRIFWGILAAMLAAWLSMNLWTVPRIEETAGGLRLLDMRFTGYSYEEVREFVSAIGDEGAALYLGAQYWLDMVFPPLLGAVLFLFYRWLFPGLPGLIVGVVSMTYVAADILRRTLKPDWTGTCMLLASSVLCRALSFTTTIAA